MSMGKMSLRVRVYAQNQSCFFPPLFVFFSPDSHLIRAHRPKGFSQASDFIKRMSQLNLTRGTFGLMQPALCKLKRCNYCNVYKSNRKKTS